MAMASSSSLSSGGASPLRGSRQDSARRMGQATFQYWRNWFFVTTIAILWLTVFSNFQGDLNSDLLLASTSSEGGGGTRELSSIDDEYVTAGAERTGADDEAITATQQPPPKATANNAVMKQGLRVATEKAVAEADQAQMKLQNLKRQVEMAAKALSDAEETSKLLREQQQQQQQAEEEEAQEEEEQDEQEEQQESNTADEKVEEQEKEEEGEGEEEAVEEEPSSSTTTNTKEVEAITDRKVYYMDSSQVDQKDAFSASWIQTTEDFLNMELWRIGICEDAAFRAFHGARKRKLRMTLDWLDFSLEHLSKWWKGLQIFRYGQEGVYNTAMERFDKYFSNSATFPLEEEQSFIETIAVIAYQPYKDGKWPNVGPGYNLTLKSLGVTMESLRRAGFGRVVVVGDNDVDPQLTQDTFRHLQKQLDPNTPDDKDTIITKVGHMEVAYAKFNHTHAVTSHLAKNVPKATLEGLREALLLQRDTKDRTPAQEEFVQLWLGDKRDWKYVYLTEPDSVLQFRPSTLKQLKEEVDKGMILVPHRLQPIAHETDVGTAKERDFLFLDKEKFPVIDLDSVGENDACCDAHMGPQYKPWKKHDHCGNFWYMCDFTKRKPKEQRTHKMIKEYSLIRLKQGTEIVSLAALEHGRPCIPQKNHVCVPPS